MGEEIEHIRRQQFIDSESYANTLINMNNSKDEFWIGVNDCDVSPDGILTSRGMIASYELWIFQLKFTAGAPLNELARSLDGVIEAYELYAEELKNSPNIYDEAVFNIDESLDDYVDYLNLLSAIVLLRRADLLERAANLLVDTSVYQQDTIIEELLKFFLPGRPALDEGYWGEPYQFLMDALEADTKLDAAKQMKKYVRKWYPAMKGQASFWGKHEKIKPEFSVYRGYWTMCAAAFTYLFSLDDSGYRDELVYPSDLIDYARSLPNDINAHQSQLSQLRVVAGNPCLRTGLWVTPARANSKMTFREGEVMPDVDNSDYGLTIWQWDAQQ